MRQNLPSKFNMDVSSKIFVAGHNGMGGSAILRRLKALGYTNFVLRNSKELDLTPTGCIFFSEKKNWICFSGCSPVVYRLIIPLGAQFYNENWWFKNNVIHQSYLHKVKITVSCFLLYLSKICRTTIKEYLICSLVSLKKPMSPMPLQKLALNFRKLQAIWLVIFSVMPTNPMAQHLIQSEFSCIASCY